MGFTILFHDELISADDVRPGKKYWVDIDERMIVPWDHKDLWNDKC